MVPQTLLSLVSTDWTADVLVDVEHLQTEQFLTKHRMSTVLRPEDVLPSQQDRFHQRLLHITGMQLRIESVAAEVLAIFAAHEITTRVLKGLATGELDYPDRALRQTGDVDLAVAKDEFERSIAVLVAAGYDELDSIYPSALRKGTTLVSPSGIEVDLHTRLFQRSGFTDALFDSPEPLTDLQGHALAPAMRLAHAAGHFILAPAGERRMSGLIDITRLRQRADIDLDEVRTIARHLGVEGLVRAALTLESSLRGADDEIDELDSWTNIGWLDRKTRLDVDRNLVLDHLARFREVPAGERLGYLPGWLVPARPQRRKFMRSVRSRVKSFRSGKR